MRIGRIVAYGTAGLAAVLVIVVGSAYFVLRSSLPRLDGELDAPTLTHAARIERDELGTPTIRGATRNDVAFATGFAHAQDRFFQMDLMRRMAAGELAELLGSGLIDADRRFRVHRFREVAKQVVQEATPEDRALLRAYVAGVNLALEREGAPWEYALLRTDPRPWSDEDSVLIAFSMYLDLNDSTGADELARGQLREALPPELFAFLHPLGSAWDAPMVGGVWRTGSVPGAQVLDLRAAPARDAAIARRAGVDLEERAIAGSNSWAVAGTHARGGAALLANDMHLGLRLPHVWYRARMLVEGSVRRDLVGVTLPGLPLLVAGSNGQVAWGYTNSYGDWTDLIVVEVDPQDAARYRVPDGFETFGRRTESIAVRGGDPVSLEVRTTRWGPIVNEDAEGRPLALAWTAHHSRATNLRMRDLESVDSIEAAIDTANRAGGPVQNFVVADTRGRIGWSLMGQVPIRAAYDSTVPTSWSASGAGWVGWRAPHEYPRIVDPASGRLWTANTRTIDTEAWLSFLGNGGYDLGARAAQIRDDLLALPQASASDMLAIQLDDRALFLTRWRDLLLELLDEQAVSAHPQRAQARDLVAKWAARAAADDAGYRIVRSFRLQVRKNVYDSLIATAATRFPTTEFAPSSQFEAPLWQLVTEQPTHLLDPRHASWREALLSYFDATLAQLAEGCERLDECTWGRENTLRMQHPLSGALSFAARWLDMPSVPMSGDSAMPRVQGPAFGASQRFVVSPGREREGYLQMPGGPVDHPLSPFYGAGHEAWIRGEPTPLLPGKPLHTLQLTPTQ